MTGPRVSNRQRAVNHVTAFPGSTLREIAVALGLAERDDYTSLSAQMAQLCKLKKLRKDSLTSGGKAGALKYWPVPAEAAPPPKPPAAPKPARTPRMPAKAKASAEDRAGYASNKAHKPKPSQQFQIMPAPRPASAGKGERETVDEYRKRGGVVEVLASHVSGNNALRFDHSDNRTPVGQRRPCIRRRAAAGAL